MARWGMPGPPQFGGHPVTNIRNLRSPHWRGWLGRKNRCIVPATSFCEYADTKPKKTPTWFATLISPSRNSLPRSRCRVGLHIDLFEACSAFTRVAARTLAPSPIRDLLHRRLQPFRHLHDCSGCFRLERSPGGACTTGKRRLVTAHTLSGHSPNMRPMGRRSNKMEVTVVRSSRDELLAAVDIVRRARECCVAHDVNG